MLKKILFTLLSVAFFCSYSATYTSVSDECPYIRFSSTTLKDVVVDKANVKLQETSTSVVVTFLNGGSQTFTWSSAQARSYGYSLDSLYNKILDILLVTCGTPGGGGILIQDGGSDVASGIDTLNFIGSNANVVYVGGNKVNIGFSGISQSQLDDSLANYAKKQNLADTSATLRMFIAAKGTGTVTSVGAGYGLSGGPITTTGSVSVDTSLMVTKSFLTARNYLTSAPVLTFGFGVTRDTLAITYNGVRTSLRDSSGSNASSLFNSLTGATANNTISNATYNQEWQWTNQTGTGLKLSTSSTSTVNNSTLFEVSSTGENTNITNYAQKIIANKTGTNVINYGLDISHSGVNGAGINLTGTGTAINCVSGYSTGIQLNSNRVSFDASNTGTIQYTGGALQISSGSKQTFNLNTGSSNYWLFGSSPSTDYFTINRIASGSYALMFGGDYFSGNYRSESTSSNVIRASGGTLSICANTGSAGSFGIITPNPIMTVYGNNQNIGIGTTTPVASSILELNSTTKGLLPPRGTTTQMNAISSPAEGLLYYDTTVHKLYVYDGTLWQACW